MSMPIAVFAISLMVLVVASQAGRLLRLRQREQDEDTRSDLGVVSSATLALLGLIIGFSFSMAISRYDQRKNYEEEEANAIGTEALRAELLPAADAVRVKALLGEYLDLRVAYYRARSKADAATFDGRTETVQTELWVAVKGPAMAAPNPVTALAVSGMNDVLNSQGYTQAARQNRIPFGAWALMGAIAVCCCVLTGFGARGQGVRLLLILPVVLAVSFYLIADIESPRSGLVRVEPQNLILLQSGLHR